FLAACGGGAGHFDGTVSGNSLNVKESIFFNVPAPAGLPGVGGTITYIVMSDQTDLCNSAKNNVHKKNETTFQILMGVTTSGLTFSNALTTGSYRNIAITDLGAPPAAGTQLSLPLFRKADASCVDTVNQSLLGATGSTTLTSF